MKKSIMLSVLYIAEIILCYILSGVVKIEDSSVNSLLVYPFVTLANKIYGISKSGNNLEAWGILIGIILVPIAIMVILIMLKKFRGMHCMLPLISGYMFWVMYLFINPNYMIKMFGKNGYISIVDLEVAICSVFYILLITYLLLIVVAFFKKASEKNIITYIQVILAVIGVVMIAYTVCIKYVLASNELTQLAMNVEKIGVDLSYTKRFYFIKYIVDIIPCILYVIMAIIGINILGNMKKDKYSEKVINQIKTLGKISLKSIVVVVSVNLFYNIATLVYLPKLYGNYRYFVFPVYFIIFALFILLFAKYMEDTKKLKEDNDLFV